MTDTNLHRFHEDQSQWLTLQRLLRETAQEQVMGRFRRVQVSYKADGSPVTEADRAMQQVLAEKLQRQWPQYGFLGEESSCSLQRQALGTAGGCWVLDPLDGTTNFTHGFEFFSCSLALVDASGSVLGLVYDPVRDELFAARRGLGAEQDGVALSLHSVPTTLAKDLALVDASGSVLGLVYDPVRNELFAARRGLGAERDGMALSLHSAPATLAKALALVDFKRLAPPMAISLATQPPYASQRSLGSVALEWCWMAAGRADLYLHGGQKLWDYAAGQLIFEEAGGASATLKGEPIPRHSMEPRSVMAAGSEMLLRAWSSFLSSLHGG